MQIKVLILFKKTISMTHELEVGIEKRKKACYDNFDPI